jgi:multicomponent Na+:H+ antiporter subunit D
MKSLVLPILVPLTTTVVLLLAPARPTLQRGIALAGSVLLLGAGLLVFQHVNAAGIQALQVSDWAAPFGITLVADLLSAMLVVAVGVVAVAVSGVALAGVDPRREAFGYHPLLQVLYMGVAGSFLTGDLFNLYVWFEVMLVASFVLMALHRTSAQVEAAYKYVAINLIASSIFLTALGLLYGATGTLNMADLAGEWSSVRSSGVDSVLAVLFVAAFCIKAGLFPFFFWLPASYPAAPAAIGAAFAGLLTKVGVYSLIRVFTLLFHDAPQGLFALLLGMSALTMVVGLVAAVNERDFRRVLAFNLVGHIGYTTASLALMTPATLSGALFYVLHHIIVITNLFLVSGVLLRTHRTTDFAGLGGVYGERPLFALLAMVPLFSLAGVPPLSGFLGKLAILQGTFAAGAHWLSALVLLVGLLTLLSMARAWTEGFWKPRPQGREVTAPGTSSLVVIAALSVVTIAMTVGAEPLHDLTSRGARQLLDRDAYVRAVLGGGE